MIIVNFLLYLFYFNLFYFILFFGEKNRNNININNKYDHSRGTSTTNF
jgi:hypothetical protein